MEKKFEIILKLTENQLMLLVETLGEHEDRGPIDEGWQSPELAELSKTVFEKVRKITVKDFYKQP